MPKIKKIDLIKTCFLLLIVISSCASFINNSKDKISGIRVTQLFPWIDGNGKLEKYDTISSNVYYYKNQILCYSSYFYDSSGNGQRMKPSTRYYYFVFTKGSKYGYLYDANKKIFGKRVLADSVLKNEFWYKKEFYTMFVNAKNKHAITDESDLITGELKQSYAIIPETRQKLGEMTPGVYDTIFLNFTNKYKDVEYSLCKELDSITKMKLTELRYINSPVFLKDYNFTLDRFEQLFWLDEIKINGKELMKYFEENEKNNKKYSSL